MPSDLAVVVAAAAAAGAAAAAAVHVVSFGVLFAVVAAVAGVGAVAASKRDNFVLEALSDAGRAGTAHLAGHCPAEACCDVAGAATAGAACASFVAADLPNLPHARRKSTPPHLPAAAAAVVAAAATGVDHALSPHSCHSSLDVTGSHHSRCRSL